MQSGVRLFSDATITVALVEDGMITAAAIAAPDPVRVEVWRRTFPFPLTREYMHGVAILDRKVLDFPDVAKTPADLAVGRKFSIQRLPATTIMPMIRGGRSSARLAWCALARTAVGEAACGTADVCQSGRYRHREYAAAQRIAPAHR